MYLSSNVPDCRKIQSAKVQFPTAIPTAISSSSQSSVRERK